MENEDTGAHVVGNGERERGLRDPIQKAGVGGENKVGFKSW